MFCIFCIFCILHICHILHISILRIESFLFKISGLLDSDDSDPESVSNESNPRFASASVKWLRRCGLSSTRANDPLCIDRVGRNQTLDFYWIDPVETAKRLVAKIFVIRRVFYWVGSLETSRSAIYFAYLTYLTYYAYLTCYAYLTYYTDFQEGNVFKCEPAPACHRMHAIDLGVIVTLIKAMMWKFYECVEIFLDKEGLAAF